MDNTETNNINMGFIPEIDISIPSMPSMTSMPLMLQLPSISDLNMEFFQNNMGMVAIITLTILFVAIGLYAYKTDKITELQDYLNNAKDTVSKSVSKLWSKKSVKFENNKTSNGRDDGGDDGRDDGDDSEDDE
jgi:hypothetical protein